MEINVYCNGVLIPPFQPGDVLEGDTYLDQNEEGWFEEGYRNKVKTP